jgi:DNA-binding winged helix-turn-helix (wHTH) protein
VAIRFGPFKLDSAKRELSRDGADIHVTPKAFDLLVLLVSEAPRVVAKRELHEHLWPRSIVSDATLAGLVKELRRALADSDPTAPVIRTAHRVGYAMCLAVENDPPRQAAVAHWIVVDGRRIPLRGGENSIGRDASTTVWLDFATVSRRHAMVVVDGADVWLEDCGSKNGTQVGGQRIAGRTQLRDGDPLRFGRVSAVYRCSSAGIPTETQFGGSEVNRRSTRPAE